MHAGGRRHPQTFFRGARGGPSPSSPLSPGRGGGNQSCLTADIWFHSECDTDQKGQHTAIGERVTRMVSEWYQDGIRVVPGWYMVPLYTRHIVKY